MAEPMVNPAPAEAGAAAASSASTSAAGLAVPAAAASPESGVHGKLASEDDASSFTSTPGHTPSATTATMNATTETVGVPDGNSPVPASTFTWGGYFQAIGILIILLIALWGVLRMVRRFAGGRFFPAAATLPRQALRMEAQLPLGPKKGVIVVRFLNKRLLLGVTDQQITLLSETEAADNEENNADFQRIMEKAHRQEGADSLRRPVDGATDSGAGAGGSRG